LPPGFPKIPSNNDGPKISSALEEYQIARSQVPLRAVSHLSTGHAKYQQWNWLDGYSSAELSNLEQEASVWRRGSDVYCRCGGEEFLLVLPQLATAHAVEHARNHLPLDQFHNAIAAMHTSGLPISQNVERRHWPVQVQSCHSFHPSF
jgi:hypothetical protein